MTFTLDIRTAEDLAAKAAGERSDRVKAECARRILAAADLPAQANLHGAASAGGLPPDQETAHAKFLEWVAGMRSACRAIIADRMLDPAMDENWPICPDAVRLLVSDF